jgi:transposase
MLQKHPPFSGPLTLQNNCIEKSIRKKVNKNSPNFNLRQLAFTHLRTDLYEIPGVSHSTILCILCNMGTDINRFPSAKHFASWLRLVPNNKLSRGRLISSRTPKGKNVLAIALRQAANSIGNQKEHPLTPYFKRIAYRKGRSAAITATARKLAIIIWNMITKSQPYKQKDPQVVLQVKKHAQIKNIKRRLFSLNLTETEMISMFKNLSLPDA